MIRGNSAADLPTFTDSDDGSDPFFGFGVNFGFGQATALKLEYVAYEASDGDIDYFGAGLDLMF